MKDWLHVVKARGDPYTIGKQYGEQTIKLISNYINYSKLFYGKIGFPRHEVDRVRIRYEKGIRQQAEELLIEFQGMANGAGVPYDDLMNAILHMEIRAATLKGAKFLYPLHKMQSSECTTYAASGTATTDGQTILGQNFDFSLEMQRYVVVTYVKPSDGFSFITVGMLGRPGSGGMNEKGLTIVMSGVRPRTGYEILRGDSPLGIPPTWTHHILKNHSELEQAVRQFTSLPRGPKGENIVISDSKKIAHIEVAYERFKVNFFDTKSCIISSANHFSSEEMKHLGPSSNDYEGSYLRRKRAIELLRNNEGHIELNFMKTITRDHKVNKGSICRHGGLRVRQVKDLSRDKGFTVASMIAQPNRLKFWICKGPPCENEYHLFDLNRISHNYMS